MLPSGAVTLSSEDERRAIRNAESCCRTTTQTTTQAHVREERSDGVACTDVNMTSVDSGVETGNDSNDSSIVQHESQHAAAAAAVVVAAGQVAANNVTTVAITNTSQTDKQQEPGPSIIRIGFSPTSVWPVDLDFPSSSFCPIRTRNLETVATISTVPSTQTWFPKMLQLDLPYQCHTHSNMHMMEISRDRPIYRSKISSCRHRHIDWRDWQSQHIERKMRLAAATNNTMLMRRLLDSGISPNNHDNHGRTPLHHAACRGYTEMVRLLLENGADPNRRDCIGNTPLHLAAVTCKISVVTLLLTAGTDVLSLDQHGYNPLQLAQTKLKMLQNCDDEDMVKIKEEMRNIVSMLLVYLQKQSNMQEQVEALSNFCSRLSLSSTSDQVQDDVKDLLANIDALNITS